MCNMGFSDHTLNMEASIAAASIGAKIIEKHITLSPNDEKINFNHLNECIKKVKLDKLIEEINKN